MHKTHYVSIDVLRVLAILAVLLIHTTTKTLQVSQNAVTQIPFTLFLNQLAIFAVPLFFLISGFILMGQKNDDSYSTFFKKRASKIILPYFFWSAFYYLLNSQSPGHHAAFIDLLLMGTASYQLYFIPAIIMFYLAFPLLKQFLWFISKWYMMLFFICIQVLLLIQDYYREPFDLEAALRVTLIGFLFFPLGMILSTHQKSLLLFGKKYFRMLLLAFFILMVGVYSETVYFVTKTHSSHYFYSQYHPAVLPYTLLLFVIIFYAWSDSEWGKKLFMNLAKLSFFVFFVHVSVITLFWNTGGSMLYIISRGSLLEKATFDIVFFMSVTLISFGIAYLIHKLPFVTKITG